MKATVQAKNAHGNYSARTENRILVVFTVEGSETLSLGEVLEVELPSLLSSQQVKRLKDDRVLRICVKGNDIHDLDLPASHGSSRFPTPDRMRGT